MSIHYFRAPKFHSIAMPRHKIEAPLCCAFLTCPQGFQIYYKTLTSVIFPLQLSIFLLTLDFWVVYNITVRWSSCLLLPPPRFKKIYMPLFVLLSPNQQGLIHNRATILSPHRLSLIPDYIKRKKQILPRLGQIPGSCQGWGRFSNLAKRCRQLMGLNSRCFCACACMCEKEWKRYPMHRIFKLGSPMIVH